MERLLTGLAARTGQGPFVADQTGAYHLRIDGHSLFLARQGADLIVHSPLDWQARADAAGQREVLRDALEHVRLHVEDVLAKPIAIDTAGTTDLTAGGAIGCALFPEDGDNPESLLRHADHAMYARKPRQTTSATATDTVVRFPQRP